MAAGILSAQDTERLAWAALAAYEEHSPGQLIAGLDGYVVARVFHDPGETGFAALGLEVPGRGVRILAFRGSDDRLDLASAVQMGVCQYRAARGPLMEWLSDSDWATLEIAGHSLGGALCQYLAYDIHERRMDRARSISACTFNGLGGIYGIRWLHGAVDESILRRIRIRHFVHPDDIIPRIGGNIGGSVLVIPDGDPDAAPLSECHGCSLFIGAGGRDLIARAVPIPDRTFSIARTARRIGPALKPIVLAWLDDRRMFALFAALVVASRIPAGERLEVVRLLLCTTVLRRLYRRVIRACLRARLTAP